MSCDRHFLTFHWEHHSWRPRVTSTQYVATKETNMWGRPVYGEAVRCQKEEVCEECGKTRHSVNCLCDCAVGERCAIRLDLLDESRGTPR